MEAAERLDPKPKDEFDLKPAVSVKPAFVPERPDEKLVEVVFKKEVGLKSVIQQSPTVCRLALPGKHLTERLVGGNVKVAEKWEPMGQRSSGVPGEIGRLGERITLDQGDIATTKTPIPIQGAKKESVKGAGASQKPDEKRPPQAPLHTVASEAPMPNSEEEAPENQRRAELETENKVLLGIVARLEMENRELRKK